MSNCAVKPGEVEMWPLGGHVGVESGLLVDGANITVLLSRWAPGATAPEHVHPHEQVGICLEGQVTLTVGGRDYPVGPGEFYHIPSGAAHAERNEGGELAVLADFFSPIRSDLLRKQFEAQVV
jgi:quercetin dioxygenase-like cupin family protein